MRLRQEQDKKRIQLKLAAHEIDIYARPPEAERRLMNRVRCFLSAEVVCDGAGQKALAFVRDISFGGCYIAMTFPFPVESKVSIAMWLNDKTKMWTDGIVISSHPGTGMGVKFLDLSRPDFIAAEHLEDLSKPERCSVRIWLPEKKS